MWAKRIVYRDRWLPNTEKRDFKILTKEWFEIGARLIGGCCRTTVSDIIAIKETLLH